MTEPKKESKPRTKPEGPRAHVATIGGKDWLVTLEGSLPTADLIGKASRSIANERTG